MPTSETYFSTSVNHASLKHGLLKTAYLAAMREKSRGELKQESYERDQRLFAGRVTVRMEELGLQATDLAEACNVTVTAIGFILKGSTKFPRPETLFALADYLGLEARWLGTGKGQRLLTGTQQRRVLIRGQEGKTATQIYVKKQKLRT